MSIEHCLVCFQAVHHYFAVLQKFEALLHFIQFARVLFLKLLTGFPHLLETVRVLLGTHHVSCLPWLGGAWFGALNLPCGIVDYCLLET
jgi:hypothetical protein